MVHEGEVYSSNKSGDFIVTNYINSMKIEICFLNTGHKQYVQASKITTGKIWDRSVQYLIKGLGINDCVGYGDSTTNDSEYYQKWVYLIDRCSDSYKLRKPTYEGSFPCKEWVYYSNFKNWAIDEYKRIGEDFSLQLDKDILVKGNKIYSPETCCFVPNWLNMILVCGPTECKSGLPKGVSRKRDKFHAGIYSENKAISLGSYSDPMEAHQAWQLAKSNCIENAIVKYADLSCFRTDVAEALMSRVWLLRLDAKTGKETTSI